MKFSTTLSALVILAILTMGFCLGGCSQDSESLIAPQAAIDTAPPAVPTGLNAATGRSTVKLAWLPNVTDADLQGFHVYRMAFGQTWPLTDGPVAGTGYVDRAPLLGSAIYAVTAVDRQGNESAWTQIRYNYDPSDVDVDNQ